MRKVAVVGAGKIGSTIVDLLAGSGVYEVLTPLASAMSRKSYGGTAPSQVRAQIQRWKDLLA